MLALVVLPFSVASACRAMSCASIWSCKSHSLAVGYGEIEKYNSYLSCDEMSNGVSWHRDVGSSFAVVCYEYVHGSWNQILSSQKADNKENLRI